MITLKHLKIFKEVARVKSMSKAAENLYISQPTISQKIQEIENYYHIKLFQRHSRTLGISEDGKLLLEHTLDAIPTPCFSQVVAGNSQNAQKHRKKTS